MLLFKDFNHSGIFLWSDKLVLCQADKDAGIISWGGRAEPPHIFSVEMEIPVKLSGCTSKFLDAGVNGIDSQIFNYHVGSGVVADNDHQSSGVFYPQ